MQALPETKRLFLREWTMQDLDAWAAILSDAEVMQYYPKPFDRQKVQDWIAWNLENYRTDGFGLWAVHLRATGELLGDCGITMQQIHGQRLPEIGFHMKKSVWGRDTPQRQQKPAWRGGCSRRIFRHSIAIRRARTPSRRVSEKLGMTLQEIYADPVNTFTSVYAITRAEFFAKSTKRPAIINISAKACFAWECSKPIFQHSIVIKKHELALMASFGETGNDLAGNRYRPLCIHSLACMQLQE